MVTGESVPVQRAAGEPVVAGTFVVQGEGEGVVAATGEQTTIAGIAALTRQAHRPHSPLTIQLNRVVRVVAIIAALTGGLLGGRHCCSDWRPRKPSCSPSESASHSSLKGYCPR